MSNRKGLGAAATATRPETQNERTGILAEGRTGRAEGWTRIGTITRNSSPGMNAPRAVSRTRGALRLLTGLRGPREHREAILVSALRRLLEAAAAVEQELRELAA